MAKYLLDYFFKITATTPTQQASTSYLKKVLLVVLPKSGVTPGTIISATNSAGVAAVTDNTEADQLFAAGMSQIYVLPLAVLTALDEALVGHESDFFTIAISSDFNDAAFTAMTPGTFKGVITYSGTDDDFLADVAATEMRSGWHTTAGNKAKNMLTYLGKFLSQNGWSNLQYASGTVADDVTSLGDAEALFDDAISFTIPDDQYGNRFGLAAVGGEAFASPYIIKNLQIDMQSAGLSYVSGNAPSYTKKNATLIEAELQKVMDRYIEDQLIEDGKVSVTLDGAGEFSAVVDINVAKPSAIWRLFGNMKQTL